jgi:uncharacterized protein YbjT (DUF2867 family)
MGRTAAIIGPNGLIGSFLTDLLLKSKRYDKVLVYSRRQLEFEHPKMVRLEANFDDLDSISSNLICDDFYCCLGTTMSKAKSKKEFKKVDYDYVVQSANIALKNGATKIVVVSSVGANASSSNFYLKTKGKMEEAICNLTFEQIHLFRPSFLLGSRQEFRFKEIISLPLLRIASLFFTGRNKVYKPISAELVANAMFNCLDKNTQNGIYYYDFNQIKDITSPYERINL